MLASLSESDEGLPSWSVTMPGELAQQPQQESPLELVPAAGADDGEADFGDGLSELEDTFLHKRELGS